MWDSVCRTEGFCGKSSLALWLYYNPKGGLYPVLNDLISRLEEGSDLSLL